MKEEMRQRLLQPGRNCWRLERSENIAFLIDAADYFSALRQAIENAREQILILGWDIDSRIRLSAPGVSDGYPERLGPFLNEVVSRQKHLHTYILVWDFAMIYALEREWLPIYKFGWQTHRRLHFRMDGRHPPGASHHQKIVVIDDAVAFAGGIDLGKWRWDTPEHREHDERRTGPEGHIYPPHHDLQIMLDGDAAAALGDLARSRWQRASGENLPTPTQRSVPWPASAKPDIRHWDVAIARTEPKYAGRPEIREAERLHLDAIKHARRAIYIENQYFTSHIVATALAERLRDPSGPELVIVLPKRSNGWLEQHTMDVLRARTLQRLREADEFGRLAVYYPALPGLAPRFLNVHDKLLIVDDDVVRIGSANMSNRSMGLDTECDIAIESLSELRVRAAAATLRNRLLAEHLDVSPETVEKACACGSLIGAIESLRKPGRTLEPLDGQVRAELDEWVPDSDLVDPERPIDPDLLVDRFVGGDGSPLARRRLMRSSIVLIALALLGAAWRWTPLGEWLDISTLLGTVKDIADIPGAPVIVLAGFVFGGLLVAPVTVLMVVTILAFGPVAGFVYAWLGSVLSAAMTYWIGSVMGRETVRRLAGVRVNRLSKRLARRGVLTVVVVRMIPIAPFSIVNVVAGASHIRFRDFVLGTIIGLTPGLLALTLFIDQFEMVVQRPDPSTFAKLAGVVLLITAVTWAVRRLLKRGETRNNRTSEHEKPI